MSSQTNAAPTARWVSARVRRDPQPTLAVLGINDSDDEQNPTQPRGTEPNEKVVITLSSNPSTSSTWGGLESPHDTKMRELIDGRVPWADIMSSTPLLRPQVPGFPNTETRDGSSIIPSVDAQHDDEEDDEDETTTVPGDGASIDEGVSPSCSVARGGKQEANETNAEGAEPFDDESNFAVSSVHHPIVVSAVSNDESSPRSELHSSGVPETSRTGAQIHVFGGPHVDQSSAKVPEMVNVDLLGIVRFVPYDEMALEHELLNQRTCPVEKFPHQILQAPNRVVDVFFGHLWGQTATGVLQWLLNEFAPRSKPNVFEHVAINPQLHFHRSNGCFKGCMHAQVCSPNPAAVVSALHKRVLFDLNGVWYAENEWQEKYLNEYCAWLRDLPMEYRHEKLKSLPCNTLACEYAQHRQSRH